MKLYFPFVALMMLSSSMVTAQQDGTAAASCGAGTYLDFSTAQCLCSIDEDEEESLSSRPQVEDPSVIRLAGIFDTATYDWGHDIFEVTVRLINKGWWDILPSEHYRLLYDLRNANCDESDAMKSYWNLRTANGNRPMHGIIGARCSGASMALARLAGLEGVPQLSPASNSAQLSNNHKEFPYFSRLVAPNNEHGEVGAMVAMLRAFGWDRIGIIATDTQFAKDSVTAFKKAWVGEHPDDPTGDWFGQVAYSDTVRLTPQGTVDEESILQVLDHIPTDPSAASRVILLATHIEHTFPILQSAVEVGFQPDTIWVGPSSWAAHNDFNLDQMSWLPPMPGYIGLVPYQNRDENYQNFMTELTDYQRAQGKSGGALLQELPTFAAETVDAIRAMTAAIVLAGARWRRHGDVIVDRLRDLSFEGVSGHVEFTPQGDRKDPLYSIFNAQPNLEEDGTTTLKWVDIGMTGTQVGSAVLPDGTASVCFAQVGCGLATPPDDTYPPPPYKLPGWAIFLVVFLALVLVALILVTLKYRYSRRSKRNIKAELESFRESVVGLRAAECKYIPQINPDDTTRRRSSRKSISNGGGDDDDIEQAKDCTAHWMWKETSSSMKMHSDDKVYGDPKDCWILYEPEATKKLERAFQKGRSSCSPLSGYVVDLKNFEQKKVATGFVRDVRRVVAVPDSSSSKQKKRKSSGRTGSKSDAQRALASDIDLSSVQIGDQMPMDLQDEPRMVFCEKDIIQISTQRPDGWAFGTKLHHTDEATARKLVALALNGAKEDEGQVFLDSGWFQLDKTRVPTPEDLAVVQQNVGDTGALDPPSHWDKVADPSVVQKHALKPGDKERLEVVNAFLSTLPRKRVGILGVERIQNLAMWQSYVVKRQTVCARETGQAATSGNDDAIQKKALKRLERKWLFHGTNQEVMDKILQQGFNRSFCGKNATLYGKGVYFARDAKYSAHRVYAIPDRQGRQYIMACRVVVGEYCRGKTDALTPDIRDHQSQSLYDSTVDDTSNPSIYVTYHDAQAYPEYLITFQQY